MKKLLNKMNSSGLNSIFKSIICWILFIFFLFIVGTFLSPVFPAKWERFVYGIFGTISAFVVVWVILKTENKTFGEYGLIWQKSTFFRFIKGFFIGIVIFLLIILMLLLFTDLKLDRGISDFNPISAFWYLSIIPLAFMEELAFRSYTFVKLNKVFGLRITQIVTAIAFALYHIITGWNFQIAFLGPGVWAFVFGLAAIWSKGIALPTGLHVALNLMQQIIDLRGGGKEAIWVLKQAENSLPDSIAKADLIALLTQILVLVVAVIFTEVYIRKIVAHIAIPKIEK